MADYQLTHSGPTVQEALDIALGVESQIAQEAAAREAADALLATKTELAAETSRAQAAEALLATITMLDAEIARATGIEGTLQSLIDAINAKIPSAASSANQLADKAFVNSSIGTSSATYISNNGEPFTSVAQLNAYTGPHDKNDYAFVVSTDAAGNTVYSRYKYDGSEWAKEYDLNNSSFTAAQWAAINSAVTAELVAKLSALPDNATLTAALAAKQDVIDDLSSIRSKANSAYQKPSGGIPKTDLADAVQTSLGKADSAVQDVSDKADKDTDAVEGNVAKFDANGNPVDGGVPAENIAQKDGYYGGMTVGTAENLVGRGVVEADIQGIRTSAGTEDIGNGAAMIREVRGKSIVWNQMIGYDKEVTLGGVDYTAEGDHLYGSGTTTAASGGTAPVGLPAVPADHKVYIKVKGSHSGYNHVYCRFYGSSLIELNAFGTRIRTVSNNTVNGRNVLLTYSSGANVSLDYRFQVIDLTILFGAGNEPATVEEFERMFFLPYYDYNGGTIVNNEATGLRTRGFNLFNPVTGKAVLPGKYSDYPYEYEICGAFTSISFEDYAGNVSVPELSDGRFFNVDAPGVLTVVGGNATDTCVHLVWSGWRNYGEPDYIYEPYWENTLPINIKAITGKLNGEGESVVIFPNGMRGVGTAYDRLIVDPDGFARRAEVKMGIVDLGTRTYTKTSANYFWAAISAMKTASANGVANLMAIPYQAVSYNALTDADKVMAGFTTNGQNRLYINDSTHAESDAATFKAAMSGVELVYELATPQVYVLDEPIAMTYPVDDFSIEAKLPVDTAELPTGPLRYTVVYPFNAVDKLRRLPTNYLSKESTEALLGALQAAGIIGGYTMTWNADTVHYAFTITPPSPTPDEAND